MEKWSIRWNFLSEEDAEKWRNHFLMGNLAPVTLGITLLRGRWWKRRNARHYRLKRKSDIVRHLKRRL
jgi:hypothetical protein